VSLLQLSGLVVAVVLGYSTALALQSHAGRERLVLAVGAVGGLLLLGVAVRRFELFVLGVVIVRPVLDWPKALGLDTRGLLNIGVAGLLVISSFVWLASMGREGRLRRPSGLVVSAVGLLVALTVAATQSPDLSTSGNYVVRTLTAVVLLVTLEQLVRTRAQVRRLFAALMISAAVPLLVGGYQAATGDYSRSADGLGRLTGTFIHPNTFGFYLVMVLATALATFRYVNSVERLGLALLLVVGGVELVMTYSRGSWVAFGVAALVIGLVQTRALLLLLPVGAAAIWTWVPSVVTRVTDLNRQESAIGTPGNSLLWRFDQWGKSLDLVGNHYLTGVGPGMSDSLIELPPHNDVVRVYTEAGTFGLATYVTLLVVLVAAAVGCVRSSRRGGLARSLTVAFLGIAICFVIDSLGANLLGQVVVLMYVFAFAVLARAAAALEPRPTAPPAIPPARTPEEALRAWRSTTLL
jgi:O-antigen ligase